MPYEIFLSYARKDNLPRQPGDNEGWVTAFERELKMRRTFRLCAFAHPSPIIETETKTFPILQRSIGTPNVSDA